jgi:hypothetical protein
MLKGTKTFMEFISALLVTMAQYRSGSEAVRNATQEAKAYVAFTRLAEIIL